MSEKAHILLFHRVNPVRDPLWDPMDPRLFEQILKYVSKKYFVVGLEEFFSNQYEPSEKKKMIITFDDGYKDFEEYALPLLSKYELPSTMFIVTDCIDKNKPTWTYELDFIFYHTKNLEAGTEEFYFLAEEYRIKNWIDSAHRIAYCKKIKHYLKNIPYEKRLLITSHFKEKFNDVNIPDNLMMSWEDVKSIQKEKVTIGSHTVTHPPLATISDVETLTYELTDSRKIIKERTGIAPRSVSYPVGSYNEMVKKAAREAGYDLGMIVGQDIYNSSKYDAFEIPRLELYNEIFFKTRLRISGTYSFFKKILGR